MESSVTEPRLRTALWVTALVRRCNIDSIPIVVARRGDNDAGLVIVKLDRLDGTYGVFARTTTPEGNMAWRSISGVSAVANLQAETIIEREVGFDPDLWVLVVEDPNGKFEFDAPLAD